MRLARLYGTEAGDGRALGREPLAPGAPVLAGEVDWAIDARGRRDASRTCSTAARAPRSTSPTRAARSPRRSPQRMAARLGWSAEQTQSRGRARARPARRRPRLREETQRERARRAAARARSATRVRTDAGDARRAPARRLGAGASCTTWSGRGAPTPLAVRASPRRRDEVATALRAVPRRARAGRPVRRRLGRLRRRRGAGADAVVLSTRAARRPGRRSTSATCVATLPRRHDGRRGRARARAATGSRSATGRSRSSSRRSAAGSRRAPPGQFSTAYGIIEDLVLALEVVLPDGSGAAHARDAARRRRPRPAPALPRQRGHARRRHRGDASRCAPLPEARALAGLPLRELDAGLERDPPRHARRLAAAGRAPLRRARVAPPLRASRPEGPRACCSCVHEGPARRRRRGRRRRSACARGGRRRAPTPSAVEHWLAHRNQRAGFRELPRARARGRHDRGRGDLDAASLPLYDARDGRAARRSRGRARRRAHSSHSYRSGTNLYFTLRGAARRPARMPEIYPECWRAHDGGDARRRAAASRTTTASAACGAATWRAELGDDRRRAAARAEARARSGRPARIPGVLLPEPRDERELVLALDLGTTSVRALVVGARRRGCVARAQAPLETRYPRPGWVEQDPDALVERSSEVLRAALAERARRGARRRRRRHRHAARARALVLGRAQPARRSRPRIGLAGPAHAERGRRSCVALGHPDHHAGFRDEVRVVAAARRRRARGGARRHAAARHPRRLARRAAHAATARP